MKEISYRVNETISHEEFISVLNTSGLAERRPVEDKKCIDGMLRQSNLMISARHNEQLVGIARSVTDFHYCCYLSDIAVAKKYQKKRLGRELLQQTLGELEDTCKLILLSAPDAVNYYPHIGFTHHSHAFVLHDKHQLK